MKANPQLYHQKYFYTFKFFFSGIFFKFELLGNLIFYQKKTRIESRFLIQTVDLRI